MSRGISVSQIVSIATNMSPQEERGQGIVLALITMILLATFSVVGLHLSSEGLDRILHHGVRLVVTGSLCLWLYWGSPIARWISIIVFGAAGLLGLVNLLSGSAMTIAFGGGLALAYLSAAIVLFKSPSVGKFFEHQRGARRGRTS